jgi:hypothetical protein
MIGPCPGAVRSLRAALTVVLLGLLVSPASGGTVRLHVQVPSEEAVLRGTDVAARALARVPVRDRELERTLDPHGGRAEPLLPVSGALARRVGALDANGQAALERLLRWYVVEIDETEAATWWVEALRHGRVSRIETPLPIEPASALDGAFELDDPQIPVRQQWLFDLLGTEAAWETVRAEQGDAVLGVVDGGFDVDHPDLAPNLWTNPGEIADNGIDDDGNGFVDDVHGWNVTLARGAPLYLEGMPETRRHGTLVAGVAGAVAGNGAYGAGVAFNPRVMLVSVQDESGEGLDTTYAYRGIAYAAANGADVINCSWRGVWFVRPGQANRDSAPFRQFENDVIEAATAMGSLVVAAAGNDARTDLVPSPSQYPAVLSVTATNDRSNPWQLWQNSNAGPWVDLAAPGDKVFSIAPDEGTTISSGTSLSAPIVAGAALLLETQHPEWTPDQIRARLRQTARDFSDTEPDPERRGGAGRGMVQFDAAIHAPLQPALAIRNVRFLADDQTLVYSPGDDVALAFEARSLFPYDGPVRIRVETEDPFLVPFEDELVLSQVLTGAELSVRRGLELKLRENAPRGHVAQIDLVVEAADEVDRQSFYVDAVPYQVEVQSAGLEMSVAANGKLGYSEYNRPLSTSGVGFRRRDELQSSLFFGSLVIGAGEDRVIDAVQAFLPIDALEDFREREAPIHRDDLGDGWTRTTLDYASRARSDGLSLEVRQDLYAHDSDELGDFLLGRWRVRPLALQSIVKGTDTLDRLHAGLLLDWTASGAGESIHTDPVTGVQWAEPLPGAPDPRYVGARVLDPASPLRAAHFHAVGPRASDPDAPYMIDRVDLGRAMSDSTLWELVSRDARGVGRLEGNVVGMLGTGPHPPVAVGEGVDLVVAFAIADTRGELFDALDRARVAWSSLRAGRDGRPPSRVDLLGNVPNPFNPRTSIRFTLPDPEPVRLDVYDLRGRHVARLLDERRDSGFHRVEWDGRDANGRSVASGVYLVRLETPSTTTSRRVALVR